jgi:hypothetical protein
MTHDDGLTENQRAFLSAREHQDVVSHFTAREIEQMPFDEFARLTGRTFGVTPIGSPAPQQPPAPVQEQPQGLDPNSAEYFHVWRANRTRGGEGVGIFDSVSSQRDQYRAAARAQAGRTAMSNANVVEPPRLTGRYVRQDDMRDTRSAHERFSSPSNAFNL